MVVGTQDTLMLRKNRRDNELVTERKTVDKETYQEKYANLKEKLNKENET